MRNLILFSMAALSLTACKRDDDNTTTEPSIVGTWKYSKYVVYSGKDKKTIISEEPATACEAKGTMVFTSDKKTSYTFYTDSNNTCVEDGTETGIYSYDATTKKLSITSSNDDATTDVLKLTDKELEVVVENYDYNNDGVDDIHTYVFTR
ncbi:lipocalin family protein [Bergeyella porcorum]|uniref:lipocalin family protein n=1 Tax=Bergeyella porcorum TaxID=1735111 RepID=UPI0035E9A10C